MTMRCEAQEERETLQPNERSDASRETGGSIVSHLQQEWEFITLDCVTVELARSVLRYLQVYVLCAQ